MTPARILRSVDLPEPLLPTMPVASPGSATTDTSRTAQRQSGTPPRMRIRPRPTLSRSWFFLTSGRNRFLTRSARIVPSGVVNHAPLQALEDPEPGQEHDRVGQGCEADVSPLGRLVLQDGPAVAV